jgi:hypothetical protein
MVDAPTISFSTAKPTWGVTHSSSHLSGSGWPNRLEALTAQITHL